MKTNSDVTDALRRTVSLVQAELERSVLTTQMLDSSTATLRSTSFQHDTLNSVMSTSKQLITALEKSDWLDRILIISGFVFFLLVVLFILKQRIVDRGLKIAFWWTRFLPDFSSDEELLRSAMDQGESSSFSATAVSVPELVASGVTTAAVLSSITLNMPDPSPALVSESEDVSNIVLSPDGPEQTPTSPALPDHVEL